MINADFLKENCCIDKRATYLVKDNSGVYAYDGKPCYDELSGLWTGVSVARLGNIEIEEFKEKDFKDSIYEFKQAEKDLELKAGQIWENKVYEKIFCITNVRENYLDYIQKDGLLSTCYIHDFKNSTNLILVAEYPTFEEAMNSKDWKDGK